MDQFSVFGGLGNMKYLDTGKYSLSRVGDKYVLVVMYSDQELTKNEVPTVVEYFRQFSGKVPVLVNRKGRYSLSTGAQLAFIKHAKKLFSAIAFFDKTPLQRRITKIASISYLRDLPVKSFTDFTSAEDWLKNYGPIPPNTFQRKPDD